MSVIYTQDICKHFKILNRREGLIGSIKDLFSNDYRTVKAVDKISMEIEKGEIVGYIGPNGAGKSTTIKMLCGVLQPTSGLIQVNQIIPHLDRKKHVQNIGAVFGQRSQLWWALPVIESFNIIKEIYRIDDKCYKYNLGLFNELVDLKSLYKIPVRNLSLGQRMLCDITASFLHDPKIVFLDEPTIGLDISIKSKIRSIIKSLNEEKKTTIILTTHDTSDIEALSNRVIIIDKGHIIYDNDTNKMHKMFGAYKMLKLMSDRFSSMRVEQIKEMLDKEFNASEGVNIGKSEEECFEILLNQELFDLHSVLRFLMNSFFINDIEIKDIPLENIIKSIYEGKTI